MSNGHRIAFAGTPEFAVPTLEALAASGTEIVFVLTQPDRPKGRGRAPTASPVALAASAHSLPLVKAARLEQELFASFERQRPDLIVVIAYGLLLPSWFLEWPRLGCVNLHASLLPRWRGAAPVERAIAAGDGETGVSLMQIVPALDAGPVFAERKLPIDPDETAGELRERLAKVAAELARDLLGPLLAGELVATPQPAAGVSYAPKLAKAEAKIDWREPAAVLSRRIRAFNPWPVAEGSLNDGRRLRLWRASALAEACEAPPGAVLASGPAGVDVATGNGILRLTSVQAPGGRVLDAADYARARPLTGRSFVG